MRVWATANLLVGGGLDAGVTRGQGKVNTFLLVLLGEQLRRVDHRLQGFRLVVIQEQRHRQQAAGGIHQGAGHLVEGGAQQALVAADGGPLQVALVVAGSDQFGNLGGSHHGIDAGHILHMPDEAIDQVQVLEQRAFLLARFHHHHQDVGTGGVVVGNKLVVQVIAGIRAQLRCAGIQVADLQVLPAVDADRKADRCHDQ